MSTPAQRLSLFSVLGLAAKAIRTKVKPLLLIGVFGFFLPMVIFNFISWRVGIDGVSDLKSTMNSLGSNPTLPLLAALKPVLFRWAVANFPLEIVILAWLAAWYQIAVSVLLDFYTLKNLPFRVTAAAGLKVFFRKILLISMIAVPILIVAQVTVFLGLFVLFAIMMVPVLAQVRQDRPFRTLFSALLLIYVREMRLARFEIALLLMSIGGIFLFSIYGFEFLLSFIKQLDILYGVPDFFIKPIPFVFGLDFLTVSVEILEPIGMAALMIFAASTTVSAYAKMEQESIRRELGGMPGA